ncbi:hypothetical protein ACVLL5_003987, partial [Stenotrophomonas sp. PvP087]
PRCLRGRDAAALQAIPPCVASRVAPWTRVLAFGCGPRQSPSTHSGTPLCPLTRPWAGWPGLHMQVRAAHLPGEQAASHKQSPLSV